MRWCVPFERPRIKSWGPNTAPGRIEEAQAKQMSIVKAACETMR